jgi:hypothetical protein
MCINPLNSDNEPVDLRIWGKSEVEPHRRFDLSFMPCTPVVSDSESTDCRVPEHTTEAYAQKLLEIKSKISSPDFQMLVNRERLEAG